MTTQDQNVITVTATVNAPIETVWKAWSTPSDIIKWNSASEDWHTPTAENDLRPGGKFSSRMEARDGSFGFDFGGVYDEVVPYELISYTLGDDRKVKINFEKNIDGVKITERFDAESTNSKEMQRDGWQAILNNFKKYVEASGN
ncbi:SRPBCC family protein [Pedobacter gandavensis]|uniref:Polyketide cyclase n=1 Tax=Pedobacter gandavensis TaxID=2679963 RepID=A0ABR6EZN3_9SPHI|nr:SRPBCC family protein [Pedobacter gandavensis]MBB2150284.1 polyketide cyclase [Pedobacter gandavensis]